MKFSDASLPFLALLLLLLPAAAAAELNYEGLYNKDERDVQASLDQEFREMGVRAYTLTGTVLYLYKPHASRHYNINAYGFRGKEVGPGEADAFNIMVMGGSSVFGYYQSDEQTVPYLLERRLREKFPKCRINVYNLGVEGYSFQREIALARKMKDLLRPDLVIFLSGFNDASIAYYYGYPELKPFGPDAAAFFARKQKESYFDALVGLANWLRERVEWPITDRDLDERRAAFVKGYLDDARRIRDELQRERVPVFFIIQPTVFSKKVRTVRERKLIESYVQKNSLDRFPEFYVRCLEDLFRTSKSKGVVVDDFSGAFDPIPGDLFRDWVHCNLEGNKAVADRLAQFIQKNSALCAGRR